MIKANVFEFKAKLSDFIERAAGGEHIVICRHNTPVAELRPIEGARTTPRPIGPLPARPTFDIPAAFFAPMAASDLSAWEGLASTDPLSPAWTPGAEHATPRVAEAQAVYGVTSVQPVKGRGAAKAKAYRPGPGRRPRVKGRP